jgi:cell division protease FtsH
MYLPESDRFSHTKQHIESMISSLYGGRIAEGLIFGDDMVTTGASNDIERATDLARKMVLKWGMSDKVGPQLMEDDQNEGYLGSQGGSLKSMSDSTQVLIDNEVKEIIKRNYDRAYKLLTDNIDILHAMKDALLKYETIDADQINDLMERKPVREPNNDVNNNDSSSNSSSNSSREEKSNYKTEKDVSNTASNETGNDAKTTEKVGNSNNKVEESNVDHNDPSDKYF